MLHPLKEQNHVSDDLVERVNQVRAYRNWVAHSRREGDSDLSNITPRMAYERLSEFLAVLGIATEAEQIESDPPEDEHPE